MSGLGKVSIIIEAAMASFESDMGRASRLLEKETKRWQGTLKKYEDQAKQVGKVVGTAIAAGVTAAALAIGGAIDRMDDLSKAAQKVGLPTEELSALNYAAKLSDVSLETLTGSLGKLTKSQAAALKSTSEQARIFKALGIDVTDATGKLRDSGDILSDFADRFAALEGSPEAMAAGFALFGRSFQEMIPLIKDGGQALRDAADEARVLGVVVSEEAGRQAEQFNDNLDRLKSAAAGLTIQIANELLPKLVELTNNLVQLSKDGSTAVDIGRDLSNIFGVVGEVFSRGYNQIAGVGQVIENTTASLINLVDAARHFVTLDFSGGVMRLKAAVSSRNDIFAGFVRMLTGEGAPAPAVSRPAPIFAGSGAEPGGLFKKSSGQAQAEAEVAKLQAQLRAALGGGTGKSRAAGGRSAGKSDGEREAESLLQSYQSLVRQQEQRIALFDKEGEAARIAYETTRGELAKLDEPSKKALQSNAEWIDQLEDMKALDEVWAQAADERTERIRRQSEAVQQLLKDLEDEVEMLKLSTQAQEVYNNLKWAGVQASTAEGQAIAEATKQAQEMRRARAVMEDVRDITGSFFEDLLDYTKSGKDAFKSFVDNIRQLAIQLIADTALRSLGKLLTDMGNGGSGGGGGGGGWSGFLSMLGSVFSGGSGNFGGARAGGGPVQRGMFYEVNERAPELYSSGGRTWLMAGARDGRVAPLSRGSGENQQNTIIAVFGEDQLRAEQEKFAKSKKNEQITVVHFQRNKKVL
jgi:hypothetical protein